MGLISPFKAKRYRAGYRALDIAIQYGVAQDHGRVLHWLDRAFRDNHGGLYFCASAPEFDLVRSDPRYADLLHRMGLSL